MPLVLHTHRGSPPRSRVVLDSSIFDTLSENRVEAYTELCKLVLSHMHHVPFTRYGGQKCA
jgi:hypothetical protein